MASARGRTRHLPGGSRGMSRRASHSIRPDTRECKRARRGRGPSSSSSRMSSAIYSSDFIGNVPLFLPLCDVCHLERACKMWQKCSRLLNFFIWHTDGTEDTKAGICREERVLKAIDDVFGGVSETVRVAIRTRSEAALAKVIAATRANCLSLPKDEIGLPEGKRDDLSEFEVYTRSIGFTADTRNQWIPTSDGTKHPVNVTWLHSVDVTWQCHTSAHRWFTMVISYVPGYTSFLRNIIERPVPLYCQGVVPSDYTSFLRRIYSGEAFTWGCAIRLTLSNQVIGPGSDVYLVGLANRRDLNGEAATCLRLNEETLRWEVKLALSGELKAIQEDNLCPQRKVLKPWSAVRIHGTVCRQTDRCHIAQTLLQRGVLLTERQQ